MSLMCAYQDCLCVKYPCSRTAFFRLPTDGRRSTWIKNSGNKTLINISAKAHRFFCENHFHQNDIRTQFNRKILRKHAVPIEHKSCKLTPDLELNQAPSYSKSINHNDGNGKLKEESNLVIEQLADNPNTTHFYEDVEMPEFEKPESDNTSEEQLENSYTLLDFYVPAEDSEVPEQNEGQTSNKDNLDDDTAEVYYVETSNNQVDSSTLDIDSEEDVEKLEMEPHLRMEKKFSNEVPLREPATNNNYQVTTSNNDYQEDKHFALSLVGYFQRMPKGKKALAKLKILQYLTELDIGLTANL